VLISVVIAVMNGSEIFIVEGLRERTEHLDIFFSHPSLNGVLFPMLCLLVERSVRF